MCPKTFDLEDDYGRARAVRQGLVCFTRLIMRCATTMYLHVHLRTPDTVTSTHPVSLFTSVRSATCYACMHAAGVDPEEELEAAIQSCPVDCIHCKSTILCFPPALKPPLTQYSQSQPWSVSPLHAEHDEGMSRMAAGVTDPQLALLETTMLKMERVQTWVLMMGGGSGVDVFLVRLRAASRELL